MAGRVGFEPTEVLPSPVFKTGALNRALPPTRSKNVDYLEAALGFEPRIKALQAHALPLGYAAICLAVLVFYGGASGRI
ncbi:MAG: hypothetical protein QG567_1855 [Campylobacterota bacterium]|nr:hypothetical protein [Campylobacterota bacterium]